MVFLIDFYILNMEDDHSPNSSPIILGRPFLKTARTKIDIYEGTLIMEFDEEIIKFNLFDTMKYPGDNYFVCSIDILDEVVQDIFESSGKDELESVIQHGVT